MKHVFLFSCLLAAMLSCSKEEEEFKQENVCSDDTIYSDDLKGEWHWVESGGGLDGLISTPLSIGRQESLKISEDTMFYFINSILDEKKPYNLIRDIPVCNSDSMDFIQFDTTSWSAQQFTILRNKLQITDICIADGGYKSYCRN